MQHVSYLLIDSKDRATGEVSSVEFMGKPHLFIANSRDGNGIEFPPEMTMRIAEGALIAARFFEQHGVKMLSVENRANSRPAFEALVHSIGLMVGKKKEREPGVPYRHFQASIPEDSRTTLHNLSEALKIDKEDLITSILEAGISDLAERLYLDKR